MVNCSDFTEVPENFEIPSFFTNDAFVRKIVYGSVYSERADDRAVLKVYEC